MKHPVLLILAAAATLCRVSAAHKAPFLLKVFKELSGDFGACAGNCVNSDSRILQEYMKDTCMGEVTSIQEEYQKYAFGANYYKDIFQRQGSSPSRMCLWYRRISQVCAVDLIEKHLQCTPLVVDTTKDLLSNLDQYLCSADLPMLECMTSPEFAAQMETVANCTYDLAGQVQPYFQGRSNSNMSTFLQTMRTFYSMEVVQKKGDFLYKGVPSLVQCVTSVLGGVTLSSGTSCKTVQDLLDNEVDALITYIKDETDLLTCVLNPDLMIEVMKCGNSFVLDVSTGVDLKLEGGSELQENMLEYLTKADLYASKTPFKKLKFCLEEAVKDHCQEGWVYEKLVKQLEAMEFLINTNGKTLPPFCIGSTGSTLQQTSVLMMMLMTSLLMFLVQRL